LMSMLDSMDTGILEVDATPWAISCGASSEHMLHTASVRYPSYSSFIPLNVASNCP